MSRDEKTLPVNTVFSWQSDGHTQLRCTVHPLKSLLALVYRGRLCR